MLPPVVVRRLTRELARLQRCPPDGMAVEVDEHDIFNVDGWIQGPAGTPYAGGYFRVHFDFRGTDFPAAPPRCTMQTKIFHPNIQSNGSGEICVSTLKRDWSSSYGVEHILTVIRCLLISPNPDSALDAEAGRLLQEAYDEYAKTAGIWTRVHASNRPACMSTSDAMAQPSAATSSSAQPLTRSGSINSHLPPQQKHRRALQDSDRQLSSFTANNAIPSTASAQSRSLAKSAKDTDGEQAVIDAAVVGISGLGAAAAAAAATTAAMTAAVTNELTKCTLNDRTSSQDDHSLSISVSQRNAPAILEHSNSRLLQSNVDLAPGSSMTWPTRRRAQIVRRGIKRL